MTTFLKREKILAPGKKNWDSLAVFNPSVVEHGEDLKMLYRAMGKQEEEILGERLHVSRIGICTKKKGGSDFENPRPFIEPETPWDYFGCEDPRTTFFEGKYYTFYTALGGYPFSADNIRVGLAISSDLETVEQRFLVTPFNAKAMTLFPQRIDGKITILVTVNSDQPPSSLAIFRCNEIEQLWDATAWFGWKNRLNQNSLHLQRMNTDHVEVGASPIAFDDGWLLIYSHIQNYTVRNVPPYFGIEALLLDKQDPRQILARTQVPLFGPEFEFEKEGIVPNIVFPTTARIEGNELAIYYGCSDTSIARASCPIDEFRKKLNRDVKQVPKGTKILQPIISPRNKVKWEENGTFNPGVWSDGTDFHMYYRAQSDDWTSTFGYARFTSPYSIIERQSEPCYKPREAFEKKLAPGYSGCEDPRLTGIDGYVYMFYTAYDGVNTPRVALTRIKQEAFKKQDWSAWDKPKLISKPGIMNKNSMLFPEKVEGKYVLVHRVETSIYLEKLSPEEFDSLGKGRMLEGKILVMPHATWNQGKVGANCPPHKTLEGWLLFYHGVDAKDRQYRLGAMLLDLKDPEKVLAISPFPILEPELPWEKFGVVNNVVFPCGSAIKGNRVYIYYGGADKYVGVASLDMEELLNYLVTAGRHQ